MHALPLELWHTKYQRWWITLLAISLHMKKASLKRWIGEWIVYLLN